ncbi:MAG TPA: hypothetical protein VNJ07_04485 [Chitinophagales bacterium]|nr:hypothetical protein [Chitinophagales bacterium]
MKIFLHALLFAFLLAGCESADKSSGQPSPSSADTSQSTLKPDTTAVQSQAKPSGLFDSLRMGMTAGQVIALLGEPDKKESKVNEPKMVVEDWWYGDNQKVRMINGQVNNVVKDVARQQELLRQLSEAQKKGDEAEVKRLMEELTAGHK